jgi:hypothetical protein
VAQTLKKGVLIAAVTFVATGVFLFLAATVWDLFA